MPDLVESSQFLEQKEVVLGLHDLQESSCKQLPSKREVKVSSPNGNESTKDLCTSVCLVAPANIPRTFVVLFKHLNGIHHPLKPVKPPEPQCKGPASKIKR